uniref:RING-type domain-containing protein n=1 Tax=Oreochromis niloticus TaxID=8128 RepID=A0A669EV24_ORENI
MKVKEDKIQQRHNKHTSPDRRAQARREQERREILAICVICFNQPHNCVLLDCGHVCCCHTCYEALPRKYCPICRQRIERVLRLYHV